MNSRIVKNKNQEPLTIEVIRYFSNNDNEYLIYSLNENDEAGYTKLYASKIIDDAARMITDENEWLLIKEIIKDVVKNNRDGNPLNIKDLRENELEDIILEDTRVFKLQGNLVNLLSENKQPQEQMVLEEATEEPIIEEDIVEETTDYETLYQRELDNKEALERRIEELEERCNTLQQILNQIRNLVEE